MSKKISKKQRYRGVRLKRSGVFIIDYNDHNGVRHQKTFRGTETDAARFRRSLLTKVDRIKAGLELAPEEQNGPLTFNELWLKFKQDRQLKVNSGSMEQKSLDRYADTVNAFYVSVRGIKQMPIVQITGDSIERFKSHRLGKGFKPEGINTNLRNLRTIFRFAVKRGFIERSPMNEVASVACHSGDVRFLNSEELENLNTSLENLDMDKKYERDAHDLVIFYLFTGARASECLYPQFSWKYIGQSSITFPKTKQHKSRTIPAIATVSRMLDTRKHIEGGPFNGLKDRNWVYNRVKFVMDKAGIEDASTHTLRKTAGAWYYMATRDIFATSRFLGHSSVKVTEIHYAGLIQSLQVDYAAKFEKVLNKRLRHSCVFEEK